MTQLTKAGIKVSRSGYIPFMDDYGVYLSMKYRARKLGVRHEQLMYMAVYAYVSRTKGSEVVVYNNEKFHEMCSKEASTKGMSVAAYIEMCCKSYIGMAIIEVTNNAVIKNTTIGGTDDDAHPDMCMCEGCKEERGDLPPPTKKLGIFNLPKG